MAVQRSFCFSPVAGIQWVETSRTFPSLAKLPACFSPVAGIQWVETSSSLARSSLMVLVVSVPLPGFSGLRPLDPAEDYAENTASVSVPLPGFSGLRPFLRWFKQA